jgi:hypothetical protein
MDWVWALSRESTSKDWLDAEKPVMRSLTPILWIGLGVFVMLQTQPLPGAFAGDGFKDTTVSVVTGIPDDELDAQRGGEIVSISEAMLSATLEDNTLTGSTITGTNTVAGDAFTSANGFFTVIQNSGNQVIIQDSTIINVTVE